MTRCAAPSAQLGILLLAMLSLECGISASMDRPGAPVAAHSLVSADDYRADRDRMVREQIEARGVRDARVLAAMRKVERDRFVPSAMVPHAYTDQPLPIGHKQTISQPYIVALMTEALELKPTDRVLEIGTGSGYQAAVLAEIAREVYSIEIVETLATEAAERLRRLGYGNLRLRMGDGHRGWPEAAPFDAIMVTAAPESIPPALIEQLAEGGRLIVPVGTAYQELIRVRRTKQGTQQEKLLPVRFVPMVGGEQKAN